MPYSAKINVTGFAGGIIKFDRGAYYPPGLVGLKKLLGPFIFT